MTVVWTETATGTDLPDPSEIVTVHVPGAIAETTNCAGPLLATVATVASEVFALNVPLNPGSPTFTDARSDGPNDRVDGETLRPVCPVE